MNGDAAAAGGGGELWGETAVCLVLVHGI